MTAWLSTSDVAAIAGIDERSVRRRAMNGQYQWRRRQRGRNAKGIEISVASLTEQERSRYHELRGLKPVKVEVSAPALLDFDGASENQKRRATERLHIVETYAALLRQWGDRPGRTEAKETWAKDLGASVDSLDRWLSSYLAYGKSGLVDRNDGSARRGITALPVAVKNFFREDLKASDTKNVAASIELTRMWALDAGVAVDHIANDAFYRYAQTIPEIELRATGAEQDKTSWLPSVRRDYTSLRAMQVVQADHHIADVFVRCDDPECRRGHRVWLTVFIDVRSRMVLSWIGSLDYPNSDRILKAFRALITSHGIPQKVYLDNGKDFRKAFGKAIRSWGAPALDEGYFNNLLAALGMKAIFAIPYRAQSKTIERLFGTFVTRMWQGSQAYVGALGKRTDRVNHLFNHPEQLPALEEFLQLLDAEINVYNANPGHRGQGMDGRSPVEVFNATRIPRCDPEEKGFAFVFWQYHVRMVRGCAVTIGPDRYQVLPDVGFSYEGKYVQVLVDPDDIRRGVVLSGCVHCKPEVRREKIAGCGCAGKGAFLCEAMLWAPSTFSFDDPITVENKKTVDRIEKHYKARVNAGDSRAAHIVREVRTPAGRERLLRKLAAKWRGEQAPLVAAVGEERSTLLLPHSRFAREVEKARALLENPLHLTAGERELVDSVELPSNADLESLASSARLRIVDRREEEPIVTAPIAEMQEEVLRRERESAGYCSATLDCPNASERGPFCSTHQKEFAGD
jgi:transposase InsO family protein